MFQEFALLASSGKWFVSILTDLHSFIHSTGMCRMRCFLAVLRSFFHSSLLCIISCHPSPPTSLPSSLTSSCQLFLGLPLSLIASKFIPNTFLGILFSSIFCTCPNQRNVCNLTVSVKVGFLTTAQISLLVNILQCSFSLSYIDSSVIKNFVFMIIPTIWMQPGLFLYQTRMLTTRTVGHKI